MEADERRARITADIASRTGITEAMIERLVHAFYDKVRADPVLGAVLGDGSCPARERGQRRARGQDADPSVGANA